MKHRTVGDLVPRDVVRARRDMPFMKIVKLLAENDVTAVPVMDALGRPMGVVSQADLLRKSADQADPSGRAPTPHLEAWERAKTEGATAEELMSAPAVCGRPKWNVVEAARLMEVHNVKRLPVVDETDKLQGIISRGGLLRIFLRRDDAIRDEITQDVLQPTMRLAPTEVTTEIREGQVTLRGSVKSKSLIPVIERLCRSVDSVVSVAEHITYRNDNAGGTAPPREASKAGIEQAGAARPGGSPPVHGSPARVCRYAIAPDEREPAVVAASDRHRSDGAVAEQCGTAWGVGDDRYGRTKPDRGRPRPRS